jgi:hypothetical protein
VLNQSVDSDIFWHLVRLSFVRRTVHGWTVHAAMKAVIVQDLALRSPQVYTELMGRAVRFYAERVARRRIAPGVIPKRTDLWANAGGKRWPFPSAPLLRSRLSIIRAARYCEASRYFTGHLARTYVLPKWPGDVID